MGVTHVFFVDDNFIGNKPRATLMLRKLAAWQVANDFPMTFSTEASVNLGDEDEILDLLWKANFRSVFIGIESPRAESRLETRKTQNVRSPLDEKLERIREAGIIVQGGFIVGFDGDDPLIFDEQFELSSVTPSASRSCRSCRPSHPRRCMRGSAMKAGLSMMTISSDSGPKACRSKN